MGLERTLFAFQVGLGREHPNRDPRLTTPQEGRKWEDVLGSAGLRVDYRPIWYWVSPGIPLKELRATL